MPVFFRIQDAGVLDVQDRVGGELLTTKIDFDSRIDIELPKARVSAVDCCFLDP
jgi:hypothetical protein